MMNNEPEKNFDEQMEELSAAFDREVDEFSDEMERLTEVFVEEVEEAVEEIEEALVVEAAPRKKKGRAPKALSVESSIFAGTVIYMSALDHTSLAKNSSSVAAVQTRLAELGHESVGNDRRGHLGPHTVEAVREFQYTAKLLVEDDELLNHETVLALFEGLDVVVLP
jgi:peptidoglycan hydrolase-like protein with peptidoglycan-binding domain